MSEEQRYNEEVHQLLDSIRCPICFAPPSRIEGVAHLTDDGTVTEGSVVTCRGLDEHTFMISQEDDGDH